MILEKKYNEVYKRIPENWVCGFAYNNKYIETLSLSEYRKTKSHENVNIDNLCRLILHEFIHSVILKLILIVYMFGGYQKV